MKNSIFRCNLTLLIGSLILAFGALTSIARANPQYLDNGDGTITDTKTGLMWMKKDSYLHYGHWINWFETRDYIHKLNDEGYAHYSDWRLPTTKELKSLYDPEKVNSSQLGKEMKIHIDPIFEKNGSGSIWSSEENGRYNAFGVVFNTGTNFNGNKKSRSRKASRAVRTNN
jgi:hypothetical protein